MKRATSAERDFHAAAAATQSAAATENGSSAERNQVKTSQRERLSVPCVSLDLAISELLTLRGPGEYNPELS